MKELPTRYMLVVDPKYTTDSPMADIHSNSFVDPQYLAAEFVE
jgi:hypothetical protein